MEALVQFVLGIAVSLPAGLVVTYIYWTHTD